MPYTMPSPLQSYYPPVYTQPVPRQTSAFTPTLTAAPSMVRPAVGLPMATPATIAPLPTARPAMPLPMSKPPVLTPAIVAAELAKMQQRNELNAVKNKVLFMECAISAAMGAVLVPLGMFITKTARGWGLVMASAAGALTGALFTYFSRRKAMDKQIDAYLSGQIK